MPSAATAWMGFVYIRVEIGSSLFYSLYTSGGDSQLYISRCIRVRDVQSTNESLQVFCLREDRIDMGAVSRSFGKGIINKGNRTACS